MKGVRLLLGWAQNRVRPHVSLFNTISAGMLQLLILDSDEADRRECPLDILTKKKKF